MLNKKIKSVLFLATYSCVSIAADGGDDATGKDQKGADAQRTIQLDEVVVKAKRRSVIVVATNGSHINASTGTTATFNGAFNQQVGALLGGGGTFVFNGGYSAGNSPGSVTVNGDVVFGASNQALFEIGGLLQGTQYDHLTVNGNLTFGGVLNISFIDGFTAKAGDSFDLFDWTATVGSFSSINTQYAVLASGLAWNFDQLNTTGSISVISTVVTTPVPEPENYALLALGLGVVSVLARRKKQNV